MNKKKLHFNNLDSKNNRPYYILEDNANSLFKINKITFSESVSCLGFTKEEAESLSDFGYFDNEFLLKIKKESNKYGE